MEKPTKAQMVEKAEEYWRSIAWSFPQDIRETVHRQYIQDAIDLHAKVEMMSMEEYAREAQRSDFEKTLYLTSHLALAERAIEGGFGKTAGFTRDGLDKIVEREGGKNG